MSEHGTVNIAPAIRDAAHAARIEEASQALASAHNAVADCAADWHDAQKLDESERDEAAAYLSEAVEAWRAAGEAFARAVAGRS
jgi:phage shock protein A